MRQFTGLTAYCLFILLLLQAPDLRAHHNTFSSPYGITGSFNGDSQAYWVYFTDKDKADFDPLVYFSPKALKRRLQLGLSPDDPDHYPLKPEYLEAVSLLSDTTGVALRWFNSVWVRASADQISQISSLPFVKDIQPAGGWMLTASAMIPPDHNAAMTDKRLRLTAKQKDELQAQLKAMQGQRFAEKGLDGQGIRIAVFDAGFPGVDTHPAFMHMHQEGRIVATRDFFRNSDNVYRGNQHGTMVLAMIGGKLDGVAMGLATAAEYILARTETWHEPMVEEQYWLAAVEWADRMGADIINSSLGYFHHRYFPEQMDGQTSLVARAAVKAARKGILVVNAAGNEGESRYWATVITPADADSVLTVGAVSLPSLLRTGYSSSGPTADGRLKPNVTAVGNVLTANRRAFAQARGTSFSAPLVSGFAACVWQKNRSWNNIQLLRSIERSASLYPYFDYAHGFGVPQAGYFLEGGPHIIPPSFDLIRQDDELIMRIRQSVSPSSETDTGERYAFYHIRSAKGSIRQYFVVRVEQPDVIRLSLNQIQAGDTLYFHYNGFTASYIP